MTFGSLAARFGGQRLGHTIETHRVLTSTNDRALALAAKGAAEGTVVVADSQSHGRGRQGRQWLDVPGSALLCSLILRPRFLRGQWPLIGLAAGAAAAAAAGAVAALPVRLKWPNDVVVPWDACEAGLFPARKLAGVLVEVRGEAAVVGMGMNLSEAPAPSEGPARLAPISLAECASGASPTPATMLAGWLDALEPLYDHLAAGRHATVLEAFRALDMTLGMALTLRHGASEVEGVAAGVDERGALLLRTANGVRPFETGEVQSRPRSPAPTDATDVADT